MRRTTMILMVVGLTLAACGSDEPAATVAPPPATIAAAAEATTFELTETDLGPILVGADGLTHYMFAPDEQGASTCYEQCAANWPPLVGEVTLGERLLGSVERSDGTVQATHGGWPLYYFLNHAGPGDVNGQCANDVWFVLDAAGEVVGA